MQFKSFRAPNHGNNPSLFINENKEAIMSDPYLKSDELIDYVRAENITIKAIILTHGHPDHVLGVADIHKLFPEAIIYLHKDDLSLYNAAPERASRYGLVVDKLPETTHFDDSKRHELVHGIFVDAITVSGHTPGHLIFTISDASGPKYLLVGDMISANKIPGKFQYSYDLDQHNKGIDAICALELPDEVIVIPGHDEFDTFGEVKNTPHAVKE